MTFFLKIIQFFLSKLPLPALKIVAQLLSFVFYFNFRKREIAYRNLKIAFPDKTPNQLISIFKRSCVNFTSSIIETLNPSRFYSNLEFDTIDSFDEPGVCVGVHAGSWEIINFSFAKKYNFAVLAKKQKNEKLDLFLNQNRKKEGLEVCFNLRSLIGYIKRGFHIGVVVDHGAEDGAMSVSFFNQLIPAPEGAVFLAKKYNRPIYPFYGYRVGSFKNKVKSFGRIDTEAKSEKDLVALINRLYEKELLSHPQEYLWWHKRFKHKKNRQVAILSDGRPGHLKQSQALLSVLKKRQGYVVRDRIIEVKYKNYFARIAANIFAHFSPQFAPSFFWILKLLLDQESHRNLCNNFFDIIVSTGNFTAPIAKILSSSLGARSASILRTNISPKKFDLAIIPEHDRVYSTKAVKIKGALTYPVNLEQKKDKCQKYFKLSSRKKVSVFVGGPVFDEKEFIKNLKYFIKQLKSFSERKDYKILVSTSRRTPVEAEKIVQEELSLFKNTEALVLAGKNNQDFIFEGFVILSDIVFCSSESISMLTEIASLERPCVCIFLETEDDKRKVFLSSIKNEINFLRYPFNIQDRELRTSNLFYKNRRILTRAVDKLFSLK